MHRELLLPSSSGAVQLDAQYNNRALVPNFADYIERWQSQSGATRLAIGHTANVGYARSTALDDAGAVLDVFACTRKSDAPVLMFIHGGYWRGLDKADHSFVASAFCEHACVVIPNYALCPGTPASRVSVAHIARQMALALAWTVRNAAAHGGDPRRICVVGHSAGGHLAAMLMAAHLPALGLRYGARRAVAISGLFELETIRKTPFLSSSLQLTKTVAQQCSPAWMPAPPRGQLACFVGGLESAEFQRQNALMRHAWGATRVPTVAKVAGTHHFSVLDELVNPSSRLHRHVLRWL